MATATATELERTFRLGATDLPDLDPDLTPEQILEAYKEQYPNLRYGKVQEVGIEGDVLVYQLVPAEFKPNG
ncbi:PRTRC system protein C [Marinobacter salarius]|uniref:Prokaryotic Ubiquitin n=1 Tax=Marinobacter salarius TaxID=1420917 RepID=A0A1W6KFD2_9GAMM|nr:PRTRC system protein C [Marinobacter salarius]ARM86155.1 prokaryotic Ubiquitin [Marinobacter salarius]